MKGEQYMGNKVHIFEDIASDLGINGAPESWKTHWEKSEQTYSDADLSFLEEHYVDGWAACWGCHLMH